MEPIMHLLRQPCSRNESLIIPNMWKNIIAQGLMQIAVLGTILFKDKKSLAQVHKFWVSLHQSPLRIGQRKQETLFIVLHVFVLLQIFTEIKAIKVKAQRSKCVQEVLQQPNVFDYFGRYYHHSTHNSEIWWKIHENCRVKFR